MKRSAERILTTHVGSLARPDALVPLLQAKDRGQPYDRERYGSLVRAAVADVDALHRLVGVLAFNRQSGDLGRLIGEEARAIRRDVHRELIETIERRGQQVWIPVTVAALVPGVIFLAVPFIDALSMFANS